MMVDENRRKLVEGEGVRSSFGFAGILGYIFLFIYFMAIAFIFEYVE